MGDFVSQAPCQHKWIHRIKINIKGAKPRCDIKNFNEIKIVFAEPMKKQKNHRRFSVSAYMYEWVQ